MTQPHPKIPSPAKTTDTNHSSYHVPPMKALISLCSAFMHQSGGFSTMQTTWDEFGILAKSHRLVPLVWRTLKNDCPASLPQGIASWFKQESLEAARHNLFLTAELLRICKAFEVRRIPYVPNKGPVLAQELYDDVSLRVFADLDLVVEPRSVPGALDALLELGYVIDSCRPEPPPRKLLLKFAASLRGEIPLAHPRSNVLVDLHWSVLGRQKLEGYSFQNSISPETLLMAGRSLPRFKKEDLLIFLSLHGFKHGWGCLSWVVDLGCLLKKYRPDLNWHTIESKLDDEASISVLTGAFLAENLLRLGSFGLESFFARPLIMRAELLAHNLARSYLEYREDTVDTELTKLLPLLWGANLTPQAKLRWLIRFLGYIGFEDLDRLRLPTQLFPLYYPTRCLRLMGKYVLPAFHRNRPAS